MRTRWLRCALAGTLGVAAAARAQESRLTSRLDSTTAAAVLAIVDSARVRGLPIEPLVDKALEGASKHADGRRIVTSVRGLADRMALARTALGPMATESDLVAAAGALYQGVTTAHLAQLHALRADRPLALPLVVLTDLIERGVPIPTAVAAVLDIARTGASDAVFASLRRDVEHDIAAGAPPAIAAATRARGMMAAFPGRTAPGGPVGAAASSAPSHKP